MGQGHTEHHWEIFEELRAELGYTDYLGELQRYRTEDRGLLTVSHFLVNTLRQPALPLLARRNQTMSSNGSGGHSFRHDVVFQPRKVERSGLFGTVASNVLIYIHKELELDDVERRNSAKHCIMVNDKLCMLSDTNKASGERVTTVFPRQARDAIDPEILAKDPPSNISIELKSDLIEFDLP